MFKLSGIFGGVLLSAGVLVGPGIYHNVKDEPKIVRAEILGSSRDPGGEGYFIYTDKGRFKETGDARNEIKEGDTYDLTLHRAEIHYWTPGYTRVITDFKKVTRRNVVDGVIEEVGKAAKDALKKIKNGP
jgi:hypothetical protein